MSALALKGGPPAISPGALDLRWPHLTDGEVDELTAVLRRGGFTALSSSEEHVAALEREFAHASGTRYGVAVNSGTAALHLALIAGGVEPGDEVIVPALSFVASAMAVLQARAIPVFADIDPRTFNLDPADARRRLTSRTRAIVAVHLHGLPADMAELRALAASPGLLLVEDAAQAHGATYRGAPVGGLGAVGTTSFNASKNLPTCGEGGLLTTDDSGIAEHAAALRQFGEHIVAGQDRPYVSEELGWNYKLNVLQAALVRIRLRTLAEVTSQRQIALEGMRRRLAALPGLVPPYVPDDRTHAYHFFRFRLAPDAAGLEVAPQALRRAIHRALVAEGVPVAAYQTVPLPAHPVFRNGRGSGQSPAAERVDDVPVTSAVLADSLVLQRGLLGADCRRAAELYATAFEKVWAHLDTVMSYARALQPAPTTATTRR